MTTPDINQIIDYVENDKPISPSIAREWMKYLLTTSFATELKQVLSEKLLLQAENERLKAIYRLYEEERT